MQAQIPRFVVIGDSSVGKTSLVERICRNNWKSDTVPTVSTSFFVIHGDPSDPSQDVQIWDTAGAERYRALNSVYYHNATGGILVFDLTSRDSFASLDSWRDEFTGLAQPGAPIIVVGNKCDISGDCADAVSLEDAERWCRAGGHRFIVASALNGTGVPELVAEIFTSTQQRAVQYLPTVDVSRRQGDAGGSGGCC